jgi:outer membrane protein assembly factor BamB
MDRHANRSITFLLLIAFGVRVATAASPGSRINLPDETFADHNQLQAFEAEVQQQDYAAAVKRLQPLLENHGGELMADNDGALISLSQSIMQLPTAERASLLDTYDKTFGSLASQMISDIRAKADFQPQDLYKVARRYPLGSTAGVALVAAAKRAADQGDVPSADVLFTLAVNDGYKPTPAEQTFVDAIRALVHPADPSVHGPFGPCAALPFDAAWFGAATSFNADKFFPLGSGNLAFVASQRYVVGLKRSGIVAWSWVVPKPWGQTDKPFQPGMTSRGRVYAPAALVDATGSAAIVVVNQLDAVDAEGCLRAFRAADGQLLWSTESQADIKAVSFLGPPAIAGRYMFAVASETSPAGSTMELACLDVTDGKLLWRCPLATLAEPVHTHDWRNRRLEDFLQQGPPLVSGDLVVLSPNMGAIFAVDRFDGSLRWMRPYTPTPLNDGKVREYNDSRTKGRPMVPPLSKIDLARWTNTPAVAGNVIVAAPQDTNSLLGIDAQSAKVLWENPNPPPATLVGTIGQLAILSCDLITGVDVKTGQPSWTYQPETGMQITGPAVIAGGQIRVMTTAGLMSVSAEDGKATPLSDAPTFHSVSGSEAGKAALAGIGAIGGFGVKH